MWLLVLVVLLSVIGTTCLAIDIYLDLYKTNTDNKFVPASRPPLTLTRAYYHTDDDIDEYDYEFLEK